MTSGRVEVITSVQRRRRWSASEKRQLVAASQAPDDDQAMFVQAEGLFRYRFAPPGRGFGSYLAQTMAAVGARDDALAELEHARSRHEPEFMFAAVDPAFDTLRADPKFQALARAAGRRP